MKTSDMIKFGLRGALALVACVLVWEHTVVPRVYHGGLATVAECIAPVFGDHVRAVSVNRNELEVAVKAGGKRGTLYITSADISANICVLVALFVGTPVRRWRAWGYHFGTALALLFLTHVVAVEAIVGAAVAGREPGAWVGGGLADTVAWMYPFALLLWIPYLLSVRRRGSPSTNARS